MRKKYMIIWFWDELQIWRVNKFVIQSETKYDYIKCYQYFIANIYWMRSWLIWDTILSYIYKMREIPTKEYYADISCWKHLLNRLVDNINNLWIRVLYNLDNVEDYLLEDVKYIIENTDSYETNDISKVIKRLEW